MLFLTRLGFDSMLIAVSGDIIYTYVSLHQKPDPSCLHLAPLPFITY